MPQSWMATLPSPCLGMNQSGAGGVAELPVGDDQLLPAVCPGPLAVAHLVEPQILGVLEEGGQRLLEQRQPAVGRAVAVLDPPRAPGGPFDEPVPGGRVEHGDVLKLGVGREHPPRDVQQPQVLHVALARVELALEAVRPTCSGRCDARGHDDKHDRSYDRREVRPGNKVAHCILRNQSVGGRTRVVAQTCGQLTRVSRTSYQKSNAAAAAIHGTLQVYNRSPPHESRNLQRVKGEWTQRVGASLAGAEWTVRQFERSQKTRPARPFCTAKQ